MYVRMDQSLLACGLVLCIYCAAFLAVLKCCSICGRVFNSLLKPGLSLQANSTLFIKKMNGWKGDVIQSLLHKGPSDRLYQLEL